LVARWDVADVKVREIAMPAAKPVPPPAERRSAKRPWKQAAKAPATAQTPPARRPTAAGSDGGWKEF
jgi:hypothetical protein